MPVPEKNLRVPEDLLVAIAVAARSEGKTPDELTADAMRRYLARRKLDELGRYGQEQTCRLGMSVAEGEAEAVVERVIAESRRERLR